MILDFFVAASQRRMGLGRQLAALELDDLERQGVKSVELNVSPVNLAALKFWEAVGFKLRVYSLEMRLD